MNTLKQALEMVYLHCLLRLFPAALGFNLATFQPANNKNKQTNKQNTFFCCDVLPFRAPVIVVALNCCCGFLEADVVESSKGSSADVFDCVVRDQELLLKGQT